MHVTLLQQTFSSSLGIGTQTRHLHHSGVSSASGCGSFGSSPAGFLYPYSTGGPEYCLFSQDQVLPQIPKN